MSKVRILGLQIKNYRSFGKEQTFKFPDRNHKKPVAIVGYNNSGKSNLLNCILYALQVNFVSKDTFCIDDFHNRQISNVPEFLLKVESTEERKFDKAKRANLTGYHKLEVVVDGNEIAGSSIVSTFDGRTKNNQAFGAGRYYNIFSINFHKIKDEIITQRSSWGNLKSFLAKHIKKLVESDEVMQERRHEFVEEVERATRTVLYGNLEAGASARKSKLISFIESIKKNYTANLRNNDCEVDFGMPEFEDIFLQMLFKIGLNGDKANLIPINHFGDGFISMFVMAVIQAIAEESGDDECLFIFEEPESFLHENHQEYFYKMVLCSLAEKGHQVIYTTHSDKMVDIFDTRGLIRIAMEEGKDGSCQTVKKYNNIEEFYSEEELTSDGIGLQEYNNFIKTIEPNLNKILFSNKVVLIEGPNDLMAYKYAIEFIVKKKIECRTDITNKERFAQTYLSFLNIAIIPHHGKATALHLIKLCKHFGIDAYVITDWDFNFDFIAKLDSKEDIRTDPSWSLEKLENEAKGNPKTDTTLLGMFTTNKKNLERYR